MTFVFYDTEATGPDPRHDQMLAFAAVLTDDKLADQDSFSLRCRMRPHQLPAAEALLLTGWSIADIIDPALPPFADMLSTLRERLLAWKPAVFAGYSSFDFDETLLAESLRSCGHATDLTAPLRLDVQRLALGIHEFQPAAIAYATRLDGQPSFRLVDMARANGITPGRAHDAMGDVTTTIAVARLMRQRAPGLWAHMLRMAEPGEAARFALEDRVRLYTEFHHNRPHHWLVTALGHQGQDMVGFDLALDPAEGRELDAEALLRWLRRHPHPLRTIRLAGAPFILPRDAADGRLALPSDVADQRAALLADDHAYRARLMAAHARIVLPVPEVGQGDPGRRLPYDLDPDRIDDPSRVEAELAQHMLADETAPWMTLNRAFDEADVALDGASNENAARIAGLQDYLRQELAWAEARVAPQNTSKAKR